VLERKNGERVDGAWILSENAKELYFKNIEPETDYLLTVYANMQASNQQNLGQQFKQSIKTRAIEASVSFAHNGGILPLSQSIGIPVYSINVPEVDVEFHRIKDDKISSFLEQWRGGKQGYYRLQKLADLAELVHSARFEFQIEKNKRERAILPIKHIQSLEPAGVYLAVMKAPGNYEYRQAVTYFVRSDIGVHVRRYPGSMNVFTRSLLTGDVLGQVKLSVLTHEGELLTSTTTNEHGFANLDKSLNKAQLLLAQKGQQLSLVNLTSPALDLSEFEIGKRIGFKNETFFYGPRDIYRPGEEVDISMLLRNFDGRAVPGIPLNAKIKRPDGQIVKRFTWKPDKLGYYYHRFQLSKSARTGRWQVEVKLPAEKDNKAARTWSFLVEDFLPERMKLTLGSLDDELFISAQETLKVPVKGMYLYGAPAAGNLLETKVQASIDQLAVAQLPGYHFGLSREKDAEKTYNLKDMHLNQSGQAELHIDPKWQNTGSPVLLKVTGSLYETGGRAVKRQRSYRIWPAQAMVGIRPHWFKNDDNGQDDPPANTQLGFDIVRADQHGQLYPAKNLQLTLIKTRRDYFWKYNNYDEWEMDYSEKSYPVWQQSLSITKSEKTEIAIPVEWGDYRLKIYDPETKLTTDYEFNAGGDWYYTNQQAKVSRPDKINLALDQQDYANGDTIKLSINAPFKGKGMVLVENNDSLLWQQEIDLSGHNEGTIQIPVNKNWQQHDIYISAIIFNRPDKQDYLIKRAVGLLHLPLNRENRKLHLSISGEDKIQPHRILPVIVKVSNYESLASKEILVTLAAVDVGVLNVTNFMTPDPFAWFFAQRRYGIDLLDLYGNIIEGRKGITGRQRFGGDMDLSSAGNLQKAQVDILSFFHQPVPVNEKGEASFELYIPEFNGLVRLMALAFSDSEFGQGEQEVTIAAPVVTQLSKPRFLAAYDNSTITLDIHNLTPQEQIFDLFFRTDDSLEVIDPEQSIQLSANEKISLSFHIKSWENFGLSKLFLDLTNRPGPNQEPIAIQRQWELSVRPAWPASQRHQQVVLNNRDSASFKFLTDDLLTNTLEGQVLISNQPPINLSTHMKELLHYPYGCLEQTTSSSFPWIYAKAENLDKLGLSKIKVDDKPLDSQLRNQGIERGIQRLGKKQLSNGGFGLWSNQGHEEFWLTAYATHFLLEARAQNIDVPASLLKPALKRLQTYLRSTRPGYEYRYSQHPEHLTFAYKAYAAYVLSSLKQAPLGTLRTLYDYHQQDTKSGLPLMHLGIALLNQGDRKRGYAAIEQAIIKKRDPNDYLGDYGSTLRDISLKLSALIAFQPDHPGISQLLFDLQEALSKSRWLSTQDRNALFMAGVALKNSSSQQWQAVIETALGKQQISQENDFQSSLSVEEMMHEVVIHSLVDERLYASIDINGYSKEPPQPDFTHFNITRTYYNENGEVILPEQVAVGELLIVELSIQSKQRIQDALIVDLIPAGFEIENQNLTHSIKLDGFTINHKPLSDRLSKEEISYQEWRDDRYVAALDVKGYGTQRLYYLLRAVTPGHYQTPPPYAEDMYRPYIRAIGETHGPQTIINKRYQM
jgi:uncharacterized protein YfaS (alpha-2-macroglobulin family)